VSGEPWARYLERRVLGPLGMANTQAMPHRDETRLATGYSRPTPGELHVPAQATGPRRGQRRGEHGYDDRGSGPLSRFFTWKRRSLLGAKSLREMHRPQWLLDDWQTAWGLGMRVRRADGLVRVGHPGTTPGYAAIMEFIPALKLGVAVLTNADDGNPASYATMRSSC